MPLHWHNFRFGTWQWDCLPLSCLRRRKPETKSKIHSGKRMSGTFHSEASRQTKNAWPCSILRRDPRIPRTVQWLAGRLFLLLFLLLLCKALMIHLTVYILPEARLHSHGVLAPQKHWNKFGHNRNIVSQKSMVQRCELTFRRMPCRRQCISDMCLAAWTYLYWFL